jgi:hypothetical protein
LLFRLFSNGPSYIVPLQQHSPFLLFFEFFFLFQTITVFKKENQEKGPGERIKSFSSFYLNNDNNTHKKRALRFRMCSFLYIKRKAILTFGHAGTNHKVFLSLQQPPS